MNSHSQPDDLLDLSLRHSLKNWVTHKDPPADGRDRLLAAAQAVTPTRKRKLPRLDFGWFFHLQGNQEEINIGPIYNYTLESVYSFKANMAIL